MDRITLLEKLRSDADNHLKVQDVVKTLLEMLLHDEKRAKRMFSTSERP